MEYKGEAYDNGKRAGFLQFLDLPRRTTKPLELAICLADNTGDREMLCKYGWRVQEAWDVTSTPWDYQRYIQNSLGEREALMCPSAERMDQRSDSLLSGKWGASRSSAHRAKPFSARPQWTLSFPRYR